MVWIWHLSRTEVWIKYILPLLFKDIIFLSPLEVRYSFLSVLFSFMLSFGIVYNKCQQKGNQYIIKKNHIWGLKESKEEIKKLDKTVAVNWTKAESVRRRKWWCHMTRDTNDAPPFWVFFWGGSSYLWVWTPCLFQPWFSTKPSILHSVLANIHSIISLGWILGGIFFPS